MWPLHSAVKYSLVWVKTSICLTEHHLHVALSQAVLTNAVSNLHSRRKLKKMEMQLSTLKSSQDSEDSIPNLAEQKLKSIFSDPKLQRPEVFISFGWWYHLQPRAYASCCCSSRDRFEHPKERALLHLAVRQAWMKHDLLHLIQQD